MLGSAWNDLRDFLTVHADDFRSITELIKLLGALASFYVLLKLRKIERKYLFKATVPNLIRNIDKSLQQINEGLKDPVSFRVEIRIALNQLFADVKTVRRRARGDSVVAAKGLITFMRRQGFEPYFWQPQLVRELSNLELLEVYAQASSLLRFLSNELDDSAWSSK